MPNIRKSFSFRDGVQVDDDDFIVRGNLVGIGTTVPTERLDVKGNIAVAGLVTTTELNVTGVSTFAEVKLGTGINMNSSGVITATSFKGDGSTLSNLPTSQWTDVNIGAGVTSIYNSGSVGVGTTDPVYQFQVGKNPDNSTGVGIDSTGNINATGVVTATTFSGNLTGNVTGDITGNLTASTLNATGVSTFRDDVQFLGVAVTSPVPMLWDKSAGHLKFKQHNGIKLGNQGEFKIVQDAQYSRMISTASQFIISSNVLRFEKQGTTDTLADFTSDGAVSLRYSNIERLFLSF